MFIILLYSLLFNRFECSLAQSFRIIQSQAWNIFATNNEAMQILKISYKIALSLWKVFLKCENNMALINIINKSIFMCRFLVSKKLCIFQANSILKCYTRNQFKRLRNMIKFSLKMLLIESHDLSVFTFNNSWIHFF